MSESPLTKLTIETILNQWPQTVDVFNSHSLSCIGCAIASFCTIQDAVRYYGLPEDEFMSALNQIIDQEGEGSGHD